MNELSACSNLWRTPGRMRWGQALWFTACFAASLTAFAAKNETVLLDGVAAHVNKHVVTVGDVLMLMEPIRRDLLSQYEGAELRRRLEIAYHQSLDALVERFVVLDVYEKGKGRIPDWAVDQRAQELIQDSFGGDRTVLMEALAEEEMTYAEWREKLLQQLIVSSMRSSSVEQQVALPPEDIQREYDQNRDAYATPERVHVRLIAIPKVKGEEDKSRARARELRDLLATNGTDFAEVAKAESKGPKADEGGDWGWIETSVLRPELAKVLDGMKPGAISDVVEASDTLYIVKLEEYEPAKIRPLNEVQPEIENALRMRRSKALYAAWVDRLKQDAYIRLFEVDLF